jgi:hypothetical protein
MRQFYRMRRSRLCNFRTIAICHSVNIHRLSSCPNSHPFGSSLEQNDSRRIFPNCRIRFVPFWNKMKSGLLKVYSCQFGGIRSNEVANQIGAHPSARTEPAERFSAIMQNSFKENLTVTILVWYSSSCSMKTCLNISTTSWPTMSVAKATRHSRLSQGCVFSLGLSIAYSRQKPETNLDRLTVSR